MTRPRSKALQAPDRLGSLEPLDDAAMRLAMQRLGRLTKPPGSLGRLEELAVWLAGVTGRAAPAIAEPYLLIAAADHGVARRGVSAFPTEVTAQMVANFGRGGAAVSVLADWAGASVTVIDVGVQGELEPRSPVPPSPRAGRAAALIDAKVRRGTADMASGPAMTRAEAVAAIEVGRSTALGCIAAGADLIGIGEMGIGNTTASSAIASALLHVPVAEVTGRGTGIDDVRWAHKVAVIERALQVNRVDAEDPIAVLAAVGGLEIAALVGVIMGAAQSHVPVVLDGFITAAAALVACRIQPSIRPRLLAAHRSPEPGHTVLLADLGLKPILEFEMRLGEGTGAALVIGLLRAACRLRDDMATFDAAGVAGPKARDDIAAEGTPPLSRAS